MERKKGEKKKVMILLVSLKPVTQKTGSYEMRSVGLNWQYLEAESGQQSPVLQEGQMKLCVKMSFGQIGNVTLMKTVSLERQ